MKRRQPIHSAPMLVFAMAAGHVPAQPPLPGAAPHEFTQDPPAPPGPVRLSPAYSPRDTTLRQVNVGPQGMNIVGDAANEPSLAIDPTAPNRLAIGWRQFDSIASNFRQAGRAYSTDGGRTWTNPGPLDPGIFRSDPVLRADAQGRLYYCSLTTSPYQTWVFVSTDGGATFPSVYTSFGDDKQWLTVDVSGAPTAGALYQHWSVIQSTSNFTRSFNQAQTWTTPIPRVPVWGISDVGPAGQLYIGGQFSPGGSGPIQVARSLNAGVAAQTPAFTTVTVPMGTFRSFVTGSPNPGGLLGQVQVAVDRSGGPRHGWVYVLCSVRVGTTDPLDVYFNRSTDGGQSWLPAPIRVNNDPANAGAWQWFGTLSVAPDGRLDAVWNDTRESLSVTSSRLYYAFSADGGTTWQGNTGIGPSYNSLVGWPNQNKMGDYYDMASDRVGASLAYATTYNGEQDVYFLRINDWDCNGNGIADGADLLAGTLHDCDADGVPDECELAAGVPVPCAGCYPNCDGSTAAPILNVQDFGCFLTRYAAGEPYANCDGSTVPPALNVQDFGCFLTKYAAGCP
ncbi:MAG: sialidase family protein [Phycisphaerales bacterium]